MLLLSSTTEEVADYLGIHPKQVYRLLKQGRLPGTRITGRWVFSRRLIRDWIEDSSREALKHEKEQDLTVQKAEPHHLIHGFKSRRRTTHSSASSAPPDDRMKKPSAFGSRVDA